jgi:DinB family protein
MSDLANRIAHANEARQRLLDCVHRFTLAQAAFKPASGVWSIAENVEHLVLAEQGSVNRVWNAAQALRSSRLEHERRVNVSVDLVTEAASTG